MKRRYLPAATVLLMVVVSAGAGRASASPRNADKRFDDPRDVTSRIVRIIKIVGKKLFPTILEDVIGTPKP